MGLLVLSVKLARETYLSFCYLMKTAEASPKGYYPARTAAAQRATAWKDYTQSYPQAHPY